MLRQQGEVCSTSGRCHPFDSAPGGSRHRPWLMRPHPWSNLQFPVHEKAYPQYVGRRLSCNAESPSAPRYPELEKMMDDPTAKGSEEQMKIVFRSVNTFDLWIWVELMRVPSKDDKDLLETVLESWFVIGRLGGFNGMNLQVSQNAGGQASFYKYNADETESAQQALFLNYSELETRGKWCRFWLNMGTADEVALDILVNALAVFSRENLGIKQLCIGGANPDWPVVSREEQALEDLKDPSTMEATVKPAS